MMVARGDSGINDFLLNDLEKHHPGISIEDTPQFYDSSVFNRCAETGNVLLTIECWQDVHPGLVSVNWDYSIPYGLLYGFDAPEDVRRFAQTVRMLDRVDSTASASLTSKSGRKAKRQAKVIAYPQADSQHNGKKKEP